MIWDPAKVGSDATNIPSIDNHVMSTVNKDTNLFVLKNEEIQAELTKSEWGEQRALYLPFQSVYLLRLHWQGLPV